MKLTEKTEQLIIDYVRDYWDEIFQVNPKIFLYEKQSLEKTDKDNGIIMRINQYILKGKNKIVLHYYCVNTDLKIYEEDYNIQSSNWRYHNNKKYINTMEAKDTEYIKKVNKWYQSSRAERNKIINKIDKEKEKLLKIKEIATLREKEEKRWNELFEKIFNKYQYEED